MQEKNHSLNARRVNDMNLHFFYELATFITLTQDKITVRIFLCQPLWRTISYYVSSLIKLMARVSDDAVPLSF